MLILIKNGTIVNQGLSDLGSLLINGEKIEKIVARNSYVSQQEYEQGF